MVRILLGYDGSAHADAAAKYLAKYFHRGDEVIIATLFEAPKGIAETKAQLQQDVEKRAVDADHCANSGKEKLLEWCKDTVAAPQHLSTLSRCVDKIGHGLLEAAKEKDVNLIIVGTRGFGKLKRMFLGSVAHYVVKHATIASLVVHEETAERFHHDSKGLQFMLCADGRPAGLRAAQTLAQLMRPEDSVYIFHVAPQLRKYTFSYQQPFGYPLMLEKPDYEMQKAQSHAHVSAVLQQAKAVFTAAGIPSDHIQEGFCHNDEPREAILTCSDERKCDTIVIGNTHEHSVLGTVRSYVLHEAKHCAVLVIP